MLVLIPLSHIPTPSWAEDAFRITCRFGGSLGSTGYRVFIRPATFLASVRPPEIALEAPDTSLMRALEYTPEKLTVTGEAKLPGFPKGFLTLSVSRVTGRAQVLLTSRPIESREGGLVIEKQYTLAGPGIGWCERYGAKF